MDEKNEQNNLEESFAEVLRTLPPVIHDYVTQGKYTVVAQQIMKKYGLRIDQGGILEREILLLLIGIDTPDEFTQALIEEAKIEEQSVGGIIQDMNDQIFVPLREAERKNSTVPQAQNSVPTSPHPTAPPPALRVATPAPVRAVTPSVRAAQPLPSGIPLPQEQINRISNIVPRSATPSQPPVNLPGSMPPAPAPAPAPQPKPVARPPITSYSTDPYREPIDEPLNEM